jgi:dTDP-4-amino-4,6-dideoxygalactose transaminase
VGTVGHATCFSFFPGKNLGALGDAGMVVTDDDGLAERVRRRRDHGRSEKYRHDEIGVASRLDGLQAAFLRVKLRHLPTWTDARRRLADRYRSGLDGVDGVRLVPWEEGAVHHLLCVRTAPDRRDAIREALAADGIATGVHYPIDLASQPATAAYAPSPCPVAARASAELVSLPIDPLMSDEDVDVVCERVAVHVKT